MKKNKSLIIILLIVVLGVVGITIAYFSNTTSIDNLFSTKEYGSTITEVFESPDNWLPGTSTDKSISVTNSGSVDEAVRISYSESWIAKDGTVLSGLIDEDGNLTDEEENSEHAAIINFSNNNDWTYDSGYYYYNYKLSLSDTTSSLIDSVTFNSKVKNSSNCTTVENNETKTITCNSTNSGYDGATYTLTFNIETVQYDKYKQAWGVDVAILSEQTLFCDAFDVGELVEYIGSEYYVLKDSSTSDDYVILLKKDPLTASEVNQYSDNYVSQDGEYPYYISDTCNENNQTGCSTNYDTSDVKKIVDGWSSSFSDDLVSIDGYKTRLIGSNDITLEYYNGISDSGYRLNADIPNFIRISNNTYWTTLISEDLSNQVYKINYDIQADNIYYKAYIRPIINLKKNAINMACYIYENSEYRKYNRGEEISYCNDDYFVLYDSSENEKYVTLLKKDVLTIDEVNKYSEQYESFDGTHPYYNDDGYGCHEYQISSIRNLVENWSKKYEDDIITNYRYNGQDFGVRLISESDLIDLGYGYTYDGNHNKKISYTENVPQWLNILSPYWTMSRAQGICNFYAVNQTEVQSSTMESFYKIRPVINIRKKAIEQGCKVKSENEYLTCTEGEKVSYKNNEYYVIKYSGSANESVRLLKANPLTAEEVNNYGTGYLSNNGEYPFCLNINNCSYSYNTSDVKNLVDNWSNQYTNDILGNAQLMKIDILIDRYYYVNNEYTEDTPKWIYDISGKYWSLSTYNNPWENGSSGVYSISTSITKEQADEKLLVRPIIDLKKDAIDEGCGK